MLPGFTPPVEVLPQGGRWLGYAACLACAAVVAFGLFVLMTLLVRTPRHPVHHRPMTVFLREGKLQPPKQPAARAPSRERPPPLRTRPRSTAVPAPSRLAVQRTMRTPPLPDSSSLLRFPDALAVSPAGHIEWRQAFMQYLRARSGSSPFSKPRLQSPGVPVLDGPVRMRTIGGAEIDRIGDTCFAVPAVDSLPGMSADPGYARYMQAMQPFFAHEVPCAGVPDSMGESFLKALRRLVDGPP